jgi:hypothetical protein
MAIPLLFFFAVAVVVLLMLLTNNRNQDPNAAPPSGSLERTLTWCTVALGAIAAVALLFIPVYGSERSIATSNGAQLTQRFRSTLIATNGIDVLFVVLGPVVLAALPLFRGSPHQKRIRAAMIAVLLIGFTLVAGFSIGLFYAPSALAMLAVATVGMLRERA